MHFKLSLDLSQEYFQTETKGEVSGSCVADILRRLAQRMDNAPLLEGDVFGLRNGKDERFGWAEVKTQHEKPRNYQTQQ